MILFEEIKEKIISSTTMALSAAGDDCRQRCQIESIANLHHSAPSIQWHGPRLLVKSGTKKSNQICEEEAFRKKKNGRGASGATSAAALIAFSRPLLLVFFYRVFVRLGFGFSKKVWPSRKKSQITIFCLPVFWSGLQIVNRFLPDFDFTFIK